MTYKFKYHPDNAIYKDGIFLESYESFIANNVDFPIFERQFFEYKDDGSFEVINQSGHHIIQEDLTKYQDLIDAINNLA